MKYSVELMQKEFNQGKRLKYIFFWGHQSSIDGNIEKRSKI